VKEAAVARQNTARQVVAPAAWTTAGSLEAEKAAKKPVPDGGRFACDHLPEAISTKDGIRACGQRELRATLGTRTVWQDGETVKPSFRERLATVDGGQMSVTAANAAGVAIPSDGPHPAQGHAGDAIEMAALSRP
jgi:hypothetical protein